MYATVRDCESCSMSTPPSRVRCAGQAKDLIRWVQRTALQEVRAAAATPGALTEQVVAGPGTPCSDDRAHHTSQVRTWGAPVLWGKVVAVLGAKPLAGMSSPIAAGSLRLGLSLASPTGRRGSGSRLCTMSCPSKRHYGIARVATVVSEVWHLQAFVRWIA